jgi:ABC-type transporter Mla maintaining outer membrane lipid asymmetry ATPase subunit MlaF
VVSSGATIDVPAGVVAGFVGPNGAGKTTTMAMLLGLVKPSGGSGQVLGEPLDDPGSYLGRVGALVEAPAFYPALTGAQNLAVLATAGGQDQSQIPGLLELVGLAARGDPSLLILDEPINGLDPAGVHEMRGLGLSETRLFRRFNAPLEKSFTVVYWDQRGAGKSFGRRNGTLLGPRRVGPQCALPQREDETPARLRGLQCAPERSRTSTGLFTPQGPQPCASTSSATGA